MIDCATDGCHAAGDMDVGFLAVKRGLRCMGRPRSRRWLVMPPNPTKISRSHAPSMQDRYILRRRQVFAQSPMKLGVVYFHLRRANVLAQASTATVDRQDGEARAQVRRLLRERTRNKTWVWNVT